MGEYGIEKQQLATIGKFILNKYASKKLTTKALRMEFGGSSFVYMNRSGDEAVFIENTIVNEDDSIVFKTIQDEDPNRENVRTSILKILENPSSFEGTPSISKKDDVSFTVTVLSQTVEDFLSKNPVDWKTVITNYCYKKALEKSKCCTRSSWQIIVAAKVPKKKLYYKGTGREGSLAEVDYQCYYYDNLFSNSFFNEIMENCNLDSHINISLCTDEAITISSASNIVVDTFRREPFIHEEQNVITPLIQFIKYYTLFDDSTLASNCSKKPPVLDLEVVNSFYENKTRAEEQEVKQLLINFTNEHLGNRPIGFIAYGHPGTGKSYHCSQIEKSIGMKCLYSGPATDLKQPFKGLAQRIVCDIFSIPRYVPYLCCYIYFDEFDSLSDTEDLVDCQLTHINNNKYHNVVVAATTNHPEKIDQRLFRAGRLDVLAPFLCEPRQSRIDILQKVINNPDDLSSIVDKTMNFSFVDIDNLCKVIRTLDQSKKSEFKKAVEDKLQETFSRGMDQYRFFKNLHSSLKTLGSFDFESDIKNLLNESLIYSSRRQPQYTGRVVINLALKQIMIEPFVGSSWKFIKIEFLNEGNRLLPVYEMCKKLAVDYIEYISKATENVDTKVSFLTRCENKAVSNNLILLDTIEDQRILNQFKTMCRGFSKTAPYIVFISKDQNFNTTMELGLFTLGSIYFPTNDTSNFERKLVECGSKWNSISFSQKVKKDIKFLLQYYTENVSTSFVLKLYTNENEWTKLYYELCSAAQACFNTNPNETKRLCYTTLQKLK